MKYLFLLAVLLPVILGTNQTNQDQVQSNIEKVVDAVEKFAYSGMGQSACVTACVSDLTARGYGEKQTSLCPDACTEGVTKLAIGGAAVYVTVDQGVWNNSQQASKAADKVKKSVLPAAHDYGHKIIKANSDFNENFPKKWNSGVQTTFGFIADSPEYGRKALKSTKDLVKNLGQ